MPVSTHTINGIELFDVKHINRATIADGNLLNTYVYEPLIQNEDILASAIGSAYNAIDDINHTLQDKKDKQDVISLSGSATKTIKNITQNANGEMTVEFQDIDLPPEVPTGGSNGQVLIWNNNTYAWANFDAAPTISRISEYKTNDSLSDIGTMYGAEVGRQIHTFSHGTYPDTISEWIQEKDYKYGILHYTMGLELYNSDSSTKWCVIDQGHLQNANFHIIGKGLYIPFAPGYSYVPIDHTVVFLKSDVGSIKSTISISMRLQTWQANDTNFHADDSFLTRVVHSDLTLFNW